MTNSDKNPYSDLGGNFFWKTAIADLNMFDIGGLWNPKFQIDSKSKVATFGSCFAQHIGRALKRRGYSWLCTEPPPFGLSAESYKQFNYDVFSCRTGNIYTTSLLKQWVEWAVGEKSPSEEFWVENNRYYDPFRPNVEPDGFESKNEMKLSRLKTITSFFEVVKEADYFIFTLGLTESWFNKIIGCEYPLCPGTVVGCYDSSVHEFVNQDYHTVIQNLNQSIKMMREVNPRLRFIFTVSPVPLTATMSGMHVLVATMQSKSILRAVAGQLASIQQFSDYFPSYEIINSPVFRGAFFEPNQRHVNHAGVDFVMSSFFESLGDRFVENAIGADVKVDKGAGDQKDEEVFCEEELLAAFQGEVE